MWKKYALKLIENAIHRMHESKTFDIHIKKLF